MSERVLIVDDETQLRLALRRSLEGNGYAVREAEDGASALAQYDAFKPDVVLLDLMLPDTTGVAVCRAIRERSETPIIVLSVFGDEKTKVAALDEGADDYLTKPFAVGELLARIRVALRHSGGRHVHSAALAVGDLTIDFETRIVRLGGEEVRLTPTEYALLKYLSENAGRVLTHPMILRNVWGPEYAGESHVLRTYINQLRSKLRDDAGAPRFIRTDPGVGYRFLEPDPEP